MTGNDCAIWRISASGKMEIRLNKCKKHYSESRTYNRLYDCSGTHTHSGPAGFLQYTLYQITSLGFFEETMSAFVEGIAQSILR